MAEVLWALPDNQGTVRDWADYHAGTDTTSIVNHLVFDAFGNITAIEDGSGNASTLDSQLSTFLYAYAGRAWDADAELYYNRARWYDAATGRWLSEDPIGFAAGDTNLSRYVGNSPTNATDPSGLSPPQLFIYYEAEGGPFRPAHIERATPAGVSRAPAAHQTWPYLPGRQPSAADMYLGRSLDQAIRGNYSEHSTGQGTCPRAP